MDMPVGQIVGDAVGQIGKAALLAAQRDRVHRRPPLVEAQGAMAGDLAVKLDRAGDVAGLGLARDVAVVDPFQPVGRDLPPGGLHGEDLLGAALQRGRDPIDGDRQLAQDPPQTPEPGARAVIIVRFHVPVALAGPGLGADDLGQERLGGGVAMLDAVLAAFLVVQHDLDRDARAARPARVWWGGAMADQVAAVAAWLHPGHSRSSGPGGGLLATAGGRAPAALGPVCRPRGRGQAANCGNHPARGVENRAAVGGGGSEGGGSPAGGDPPAGPQAPIEAMSITKRYFTSPFSIRS